MAVVKKAAVAVEQPIRSFADDMVNASDVQVSGKLGAGRPLDAVVWPQNLIEAFNRDHLANRMAVVLTHERLMVGRVPVLCGDDEVVVRHPSIRDGHDLVAIRYRQSAAGQEVVLDVYEDEGFRGW